MAQKAVTAMTAYCGGAIGSGKCGVDSISAAECGGRWNLNRRNVGMNGGVLVLSTWA